jgi:hypothetical protein
MANIFRRDHRAFLLHFTGWRSALFPFTTTPVPYRKKARSSRVVSAPCRMIGVLPPAARRRSLRSVSKCSLRLRFTFPFAEPQAEAKLSYGWLTFCGIVILLDYVANFSFVCTMHASQQCWKR